MITEEKKICRLCQDDLPLSNFRATKRTVKSGYNLHYNKFCRKCESKTINEYQKNKFRLMRENNPDEYAKFLVKHSRQNCKSRMKSVEDINDNYISDALKIRVVELRKNPDLMEAKRAHLQLYRLLKKIKETNEKNKKHQRPD